MDLCARGPISKPLRPKAGGEHPISRIFVTVSNIGSWAPRALAVQRPGSAAARSRAALAPGGCRCVPRSSRSLAHSAPSLGGGRRCAFPPHPPPAGASPGALSFEAVSARPRAAYTPRPAPCQIGHAETDLMIIDDAALQLQP